MLGHSEQGGTAAPAVRIIEPAWSIVFDENLAFGIERDGDFFWLDNGIAVECLQLAKEACGEESR